jgi:hypothetical protein
VDLNLKGRVAVAAGGANGAGREIALGICRRGRGGLGQSPEFRGTLLTQLRRFEYFRTPKWLRLLRPTPKGRHYSGISGTGPAVILGGG